MHVRNIVFIFCFYSALMEKSYGQTELQAWGNITGIRIEGELMRFESSLRVVGNQLSSITATGKERQSPKFRRDSSGQVVNTGLGGIAFTETVTDSGPGKDLVTIRFVSNSDTLITGTFFCISLPLKEYGLGTISFGNAQTTAIVALKPDSLGELMRISARELRVNSPLQQLRIRWQEPGLVFIRQGLKTNDDVLEVYIPLHSGNLHAGQSEEKTFTVQSTGPIDKKDIHLILDTVNPGREFAGFGGNFRIQNLKTDPEVIDYCLNNMRVAWGRVEMPWRFWQPEKNSDPVAAARAGHLDDHVQRAMVMAQKL